MLMHCLDPQLHGAPHPVVDLMAHLPPSCFSTFPEHIERAVHADEQHGQPSQPPRAVWQDAQGPRIGIVVPHIDHDVETQPSVCCYGLV